MTKLREGFTRITEREGRVKNFDPYGDGKGMFVYTEMEGAKLFRKRFGKSKTREEALALIVETGLADEEKVAEEVLNYMVDNDIPYRRRFLLDFDDWHYFTLIPDREKKNYEMNNYSPTIVDFFRAWKAATYE